MGVLKQLYRAGILVKRSKCSNVSLVPIFITFTETYSKPFTNFLQRWVDELVTLDDDAPDFMTQSLEITDTGSVLGHNVIKAASMPRVLQTVEIKRDY